MINKAIAKEKHAVAKWMRNPLQMLAAAGLLFGASLMQSCDKDLLTGQPEWLGNSIYERLQDGIETNDGQRRQFTTTLKLIDDLGYKETLSRTGSKTVFATPDDVFDKWFKDNNTSYDKLTAEQKKSLFNNSMVNNAYLIELMSNVTGNPPQEGYCLRRETATSIFDNIPKMELASMPVNPMGKDELDSWAMLRDEKKDIYICKDATTAPMMHFLPAFMKQNNITSEDLKIISNGKSDNIEDSWINGTKVISKEQTCKNGYVYVVDGVIEGTTNMAQKLHELPNTTMWARALDRFSTPVEITDYTTLNTFRRMYNVPDDEKLYSLGYFNSTSNHKRVNNGTLENDLNESGVLRIDPGWNQYSVTTTGQTMHYDGAVMIVPTDEALTDWFEYGSGSDLKDRFEEWDKIDYETLVTLLNVNMQESFVGSVPSKFNSVLDNTSQRQLGIKKEDIVACYMCCNGVIYLVKEVYAPASYKSVMYPAMLQTNGTYSVMYHALTGYYSSYSSSYDFSPYLSAMDSRFGLIIPYNVTPSKSTIVANKSKVFRMVDPCTFGMANQTVFEFYYADNKVQAVSYKATADSQGNLTVNWNSSQNVSEDVVKNRLYDLIDNNIVIFDKEKGITGFTPSQLYYQTKTGGMIKAYKEGGVQHIDGGFQIERGETVVVPHDCIADKGEDGNGATYGVSSIEAQGEDKIMDIPMSPTKSVYQVLNEEANRSGNLASAFFKLLKGSSLLSATEGAYECAGNKDENLNVNVFDSYHYTVYVPTDGEINKLISSGALPTWEDYDSWEKDTESDDAKVKEHAEAMRTAIKNRINDFLRYHIQDKSVIINGEKFNAEAFESAKLNPANNRFFPLIVTVNESTLEVKDNLGNVRKVSGNFKNKLVREYWIKNKGKNTAMLDASSYAVVHQIDGVLLYSQDQLQPQDWKCPTTAPTEAKRVQKSVRRK